MSTRLRRVIALGVVALAFLTAACSVDPARLRVPTTGTDGSVRRVSVEFANVLNLPTRARVAVNGVDAGRVTGVRRVEASAVRPAHVVVDVDVSSAIVLPPSTRAEIRQPSVLGDVFVALTVDPDDHRPSLRDGGVIPLSQTVPPVQIEDTMAALASFVNSGAVGQAQQIVSRLNAVLPDDPRTTAELASVLTGDLADLGRNADAADRFLDGMAGSASLVRARADILRERLTPDGALQVSGAIATFVRAIGVIGALGPVAHDMEWLAPLAQAGDAAATTLAPLFLSSAPLDTRSPSNLAALVSLLRDKVIPFVEHGPKLDVRSVRSDDGARGVDATAQTEAIIGTLRMIGAVR